MRNTFVIFIHFLTLVGKKKTQLFIVVNACSGTLNNNIFANV